MKHAGGDSIRFTGYSHIEHDSCKYFLEILNLDIKKYSFGFTNISHYLTKYSL